MPRTRDLRARDIRTTKCFERDVRCPDHEEQDDKLWAWVSRTTQHELQEHFKKLFLRVRITISCRMNFDDYPLDAHTCQFQVGSCKSLTQKGQHAKLFSLQITTQKTWWLARPSSSTTWSGSAVYSISSQSKTCRSSFTPSSFPQVIHVTTMAKCISIKNTSPEICILISASWDIYSLSKKIYRRSQMVTAAQKSTFS